MLQKDDLRLHLDPKIMYKPNKRVKKGEDTEWIRRFTNHENKKKVDEDNSDISDSSISDIGIINSRKKVKPKPLTWDIYKNTKPEKKIKFRFKSSRLNKNPDMKKFSVNKNSEIKKRDSKDLDKNDGSEEVVITKTKLKDSTKEYLKTLEDKSVEEQSHDFYVTGSSDGDSDLELIIS
mmetsp:Transcript_29812/g.26370  ORF Transcript_29812/g.26370 Transcript_29812/m.26370 type:complete len:178 (+) Transcript_29812:165-698(+)